MNKPLLNAAAIALGLAATLASAQSDWDIDGDGAYSFQELLVAMPAMTAECFAEIDSDGDGLVSEAEMLAAQEAGLVVTDG